ncbi:MT-A70 family methyltransferase [Shinella sp.]|uniref:MT-A70 family methyltransferase n=1 Tax=Shinella sp. TaxID=1870904 RepID=UPI0039E2C9F6
MSENAPYQVMPPLSPDDYAALEADIVKNGVLVPVEYDEHGNILDGHNRVAICESLGLVDWPRFVRKGLSEEEKRSHARSLNLARRHLSSAQKRELIETQLRETPSLSSRAIAARLGVDDKTVSSVRGKLEATAEIPQLDKTVGADGRERRKPIRTMFVPDRANIPELKKVSKQIRAEEQKARHAVRSDLATQIAARQDASPWWRAAGGNSGKAFPVIYADPPHRFETYSAVTGGEKSADNHYPTMSLDDILALGCPAASVSALFLWVTDLANGLRIMGSWGFVYKSFWAWKKLYPGEQTGTGYWSFDNCELLLIGTRGDFPAPLPGTQPIKCTDHPVGRHSRKPVFFAEQIDRLYPDMPKLEMFQRKESLAAGDVRLAGQWEFWGNQAGRPEGEAA